MSDWPYCTHGHANRPKGCVACCHDRIAELEDERDIFQRTLNKRSERVTYLESESAHNALVAQNRYTRIAELEGALRDIKEAWDEGDVNEQDRIMREVLGDE